MSGFDEYAIEDGPLGSVQGPAQSRKTVQQGMREVLKRAHRAAGGDAVEARERDDPQGALQAPHERRQIVEESSFQPGTYADGTPIRDRTGAGPRRPAPAQDYGPESPVNQGMRRTGEHMERLRESATRPVVPGDAKAHIREAMRLFRQALDHLAQAHDAL